MLGSKLCKSFEENVIKRVVCASQQPKSLNVRAHYREGNQVNALLFSQKLDPLNITLYLFKFC